MPSSIATPFTQTVEPMARVCIERRIFVGEDREAFIKDWLEPFDADYYQGRIEGYVLDLTGGKLWAAIDLSYISDAAYRDIALLSVEPDDDVQASRAFVRLIGNCDPVTAENVLTCSFDFTRWPILGATCKAFTRDYSSVPEQSVSVVDELSDQSLTNDEVSWEFIPMEHSRLPIDVAAAGEDKHVFHCVLPNGSKKNHYQSGSEDTQLAGGIVKVRVEDDETVGLAKRLAGSPWPEQLDRKNFIVFLTCIEAALIHRHKFRDVKKIEKLRSALLPWFKPSIGRD